MKTRALDSCRSYKRLDDFNFLDAQRERLERDAEQEKVDFLKRSMRIKARREALKGGKQNGNR